MNLDKLTSFVISVVMAAAIMGMGNLDRLQLWVLKSQSKLLYESRASAWGSPSVFKSVKMPAVRKNTDK